MSRTLSPFQWKPKSCPQPEDTSIRHIPLTLGLVAIVSAEDYESVSKLRWHAKWSKCVNAWYARGFIPPHLKHLFPGFPNLPYLHRVITNAPDGMDVHHENHDTLNCTRGNLTVCPRQNNTQAKKIRVDNQAGLKGVNKRPNGKYRARIWVDGKNLDLGIFDTAEEAHDAYLKAADEHFKEFAYAG